MKGTKRIMARKIVTILLLLCFQVIVSSCTAPQMRRYYSQKDNYVNATGTISHIAYDEEYDSLYLGFSELTPKFDDTCFNIVGDNFEIVKERGIEQKIEIGTKVEFVTAPEYFGDGYVMPIVAISADGEELLEFEEGFDNLQKWLK